MSGGEFNVNLAILMGEIPTIDGKLVVETTHKNVKTWGCNVI